ncbi:MAG: hypothetical protein NUV74_05275 [Candidatus Brocadiaceae bacterium]|nr:hypothetical protein [Candidatus Brocadiaceae bacterium]
MDDICDECNGDDTTCGSCDGTGYGCANYPNDPATCKHDGLMVMDHGFHHPPRCTDCGARV